MKPTTISVLAADLLQTVIDAFAQPGVTNVPPARQFVTTGTPVWYCEQVTVAWTQFRPVSPFPMSQVSAPKSVVVPAVDFSIEVVRSCWPQVEPATNTVTFPDPAALTAAARIISDDVAAVGSYLQVLSVEGGMFPSVPAIARYRDVAVGSAVPVGPQGTLAGFRLPVQVKLAIP